jgi:hypothetical protein
MNNNDDYLESIRVRESEEIGFINILGSSIRKTSGLTNLLKAIESAYK